jgi:hypothetical protein
VTEIAVIPAGSLVIMTSGVHEDYGIHGVFRAKSEIDAGRLRDEWISQHPEQARRYSFRHDQFIRWLAHRGIIEAEACHQWRLCIWGDAQEMDISPIDFAAED